MSIKIEYRPDGLLDYGLFSNTTPLITEDHFELDRVNLRIWLTRHSDFPSRIFRDLQVEGGINFFANDQSGLSTSNRNPSLPSRAGPLDQTLLASPSRSDVYEF